MKMERVLTTGGAGFIGSALESILMRSKDNQVSDDLSTGSKKIYPIVCGTPWIFYSSKSGGRSDVVFHESQSNSGFGEAYDTRKGFEQNVIATYNLVEAIRKSSVCVNFDRIPRSPKDANI